MSPSATAALALVLATVSTPAFAWHSTHARSASRVPQPRLVATPRHGRALPVRAHQIPTHLPHSTADRHLRQAHDRRHSQPQPLHLAHATPLRHPGQHLQLAASRQVSVIHVIRRTADHPQLPDITEAATQPLALPRITEDRGHLLMPAALVGSHEILLHQNAMADADGLGRIQDDADLDTMRARGMLVALPADNTLAVDQRLPLNRRYARPWTVQFLQDLARDHYNRFHSPLQLTSAVRTVEFQQKLIHRNGNAAPADGDTASPHLTGQAIDLGKRGMALPEIAWMRGYLLPLIESGKIDVEEEFKQSCFHISVYRRYAGPLPAQYDVASRGFVTTATPALH